MKSSTLFLPTLLLLFASCQSTGSAGNAATGGKVSETDESRMVADLAAAQHIARWGREHKSALALAAAASVMNQTPTGGEAPKAEGPSTPVATKDGKAKPASADSLLAEARALAGGDQALLSAIDRAKEGSRGRVDGPGTASHCVGGYSEIVYRDEFRGGELARVVVDGDGDSDLDVYVYDGNGYLIDSDTDNSDFCVLSWIPRRTGVFKIVVRNVGRVTNCYTLTTN